MSGVMDDGGGKVLDLLEELGLARHTLLLFTSDNGSTGRAVNHLDSAGEHRFSLERDTGQETGLAPARADRVAALKRMREAWAREVGEGVTGISG
jgi:arylsulfatase A-like enzyme